MTDTESDPDAVPDQEPEEGSDPIQIDMSDMETEETANWMNPNANTDAPRDDSGDTAGADHSEPPHAFSGMQTHLNVG